MLKLVNEHMGIFKTLFVKLDIILVCATKIFILAIFHLYYLLEKIGYFKGKREVEVLVVH